MFDPWKLYDDLVEQIPEDVTVVSIVENVKWWQVASSDSGVGMAFNMRVESIPRQATNESLLGKPLREVAQLAKSWNFAEAGLGMAALNSWYARAQRALSSGFTPSVANNFAKVFDPWTQAVSGKRVAVIGHFPFAARAFANAGELFILERLVQAGDYPDSACEYVLPTCDYVFISGSSFVNKTVPRLLELSQKAVSIVLGPSTPASPLLFTHGADGILPFACEDAANLKRGIEGELLGGMYDAGQRIEAFRPGYDAPRQPLAPNGQNMLPLL